MNDLKEKAQVLKLDLALQSQDQEIWQLHFAPPPAAWNKDGIFRGTFIESDYDRLYLIPHGDEKIFVKLHDYKRIKLIDIPSSWTMKVAGKNAYDWKYAFIEKYPQTRGWTEMALYIYHRQQL